MYLYVYTYIQTNIYTWIHPCDEFRIRPYTNIRQWTPDPRIHNLDTRDKWRASEPGRFIPKERVPYSESVRILIRINFSTWRKWVPIHQCTSPPAFQYTDGNIPPTDKFCKTSEVLVFTVICRGYTDDAVRHLVRQLGRILLYLW